jgi:chaperonin GroES
MSEYNSGLKPLWDHVVVELSAPQEQKRGVLYVPPSATDNKPMQGIIVAIGPGKEDVDMSVFKLGAQILFRQYAGTEFERDDKKYLVVRAGDVMCEISE